MKVRGEIEQSPHQLQRLAGVDRRHAVDDRTALRLEVERKLACFSPVGKRAGAADLGEALPYICGHLARCMLDGQFQA